MLSVSAARAQRNWPGFRGPTGQGISDSKNLPLEWSPTKNLTWKTAIHGKAWSSPVIWKDQVWLTTATEDGRELSVVCLDKATGTIVLDRVLFHVENPQYCIPFNSYASPTPCIEEGRVYVTFGSPGTACLDTSDFKVLWQRTDFVCNHFRGAGSSPALFKNLLIMNFDGSDYQYIAAVDKNTGATVWKSDRSIDYQDIDARTGRPRAEGDFRKAFSTPRIVDVGGSPLLVSVGSHATYGYDPTTGKELWRTEYRVGHSGSLTPVCGSGLIFTGTGHGATELWAIRPGGTGVVNDTNIVWRDKKKVPTRPSPLYLDGLLYMVTDVGVVSCLDAATGDAIWSGRIEDTYSASPIAAHGRLYFCSEKGRTTVLAAGREFKVLAENQLDNGIMACPAVSGDSLFIRTRTDLYRIDAGK